MKYKKDPLSYRNSDISPIGDAIKEYLKAFKVERKFNETKIVSSWETIMGKAIANQTGRLFVNNKKLYVEIKSAPLKHELSMGKSKLIDILNQGHENKIIEEVIFI